MEGSFTFRDETERAQQLSRRARGETQGQTSSVDSSVARTDTQEPMVIDASALRSHFSWLNERALAGLPAHIKRDPTILAVERFFAKWIAYPDDVSPGYMHSLPLLHEMSAPNSVLHLSVLAVAFADLRFVESGSREYEFRGLRSYGSAITRLRVIVQEPNDFKDDQTLAAILLLDIFEVLFYISLHNLLG